jgi:hypothetical protein
MVLSMTALLHMPHTWDTSWSFADNIFYFSQLSKIVSHQDMILQSCPTYVPHNSSILAIYIAFVSLLFPKLVLSFPCHLLHFHVWIYSDMLLMQGLPIGLVCPVSNCPSLVCSPLTSRSLRKFDAAILIFFLVAHRDLLPRIQGSYDL